MYTHLLAATDFSPPADELLDQLDDFRQLGVEQVTLVHVHHISYPSSTAEVLTDHYRQQLAKTGERLASLDVELDSRYVEGRPAVQLVETALEVDADMIAVANKGRGAVGEVIVGSTAMEVLRRTDRPVFLYSRSAAEDRDALIGDSVFHPTDFSEAADRALKAVEPFGRFDEEMSATLLHVFDAGGSRKADLREQKKEKLEQRARQFREAGFARVEVELERGRPRRVVKKRLGKHPDALVAIGTHGRGAVGDLFLGGTTRVAVRKGTHHMLVVPGDR